MTDKKIITRAVELLKAGRLASSLPTALMQEFNITVKRARRLAATALDTIRKGTEQ